MNERLYPWGSEISVTAEASGDFSINSFFAPSRVQISMTSSGSIWLESVNGNQINLGASEANISAMITLYR